MGRTTTAAHKRARAASEVRQGEDFRRYCQRETITSIAKSVGISKNTVLRDVDRALSKCRERTKADVDEIKAEALAQNEALKEAAWLGWKRSLQTDRSRSNTEGGTDKGGFYSNTTRTARTTGDPRYLAQISKCLEFECKLLGVIDGDQDQGGSTTNVQFVEIVIGSRKEKDQLLSLPEFLEARKARESQELIP